VMPINTGKTKMKGYTRETALAELAQLAAFYHAEIQRCISSEAWFSASILGGACCEASLMMMCLKFENEVLAATNLKDPPRGNYLDWLFARKLNQLIDTALKLEWIKTSNLPSRTRDFFAEILRRPLKSSNNTPKLTWAIETVMESELPGLALNSIRHTRNLIHPGRCLKDHTRPNHMFPLKESRILVYLWLDVLEGLTKSLKEKNRTTI
jgi:hypothetical protein